MFLNNYYAHNLVFCMQFINSVNVCFSCNFQTWSQATQIQTKKNVQEKS